MPDFISALTNMTNDIYTALLILIVAVAAVAILITVVSALTGPAKEKEEKLKHVAWILIFVVVAAMARGIVNWAFGV